MPDTYIEPCFQRLAGLLSLRYECLKAKRFVSLQSNKNYLGEKNHDHHVDVVELSLLVQKFLS
jgi:hypothetical protein